MQEGDGVLERELVDRTAAGGKGGAQDPVVRVPVGGLWVGADEHVGETPGAVDVFGDRRIGQTEAVEGHVALGMVVPLVDHAAAGDPGRLLLPAQAIVFIVQLWQHPAEDRVAGRPVGAGRRVPDHKGVVEDLAGAAHGVEDAPVVDLLVVVVDVVGVIQHAAGRRVLLDHQGRVAFADLDELALQQGPFGRRLDPGGGDGWSECGSGHIVSLGGGATYL